MVMSLFPLDGTSPGGRPRSTSERLMTAARIGGRYGRRDLDHITKFTPVPTSPMMNSTQPNVRISPVDRNRMISPNDGPALPGDQRDEKPHVQSHSGTCETARSSSGVVVPYPKNSR